MQVIHVMFDRHTHVGGRCTVSVALKWASLELLLDLRSLHLFCTSFALEMGLINGQSADLRGPTEVQRKHILSAALTVQLKCPGHLEVH